MTFLVGLLLSASAPEVPRWWLVDSAWEFRKGEFDGFIVLRADGTYLERYKDKAQPEYRLVRKGKWEYRNNYLSVFPEWGDEEIYTLRRNSSKDLLKATWRGEYKNLSGLELKRIKFRH